MIASTLKIGTKNLGGGLCSREAATELSVHIVITIFLSLAFLCLFLLLFLFFKPQSSPTRSEAEIGPLIAGLSATYVPHFDVLFACEDYEKLKARHGLRPVSAKFRRDRRRIVLMWLSELQRDVRVVWEFRRFLVRNGLPVEFREELAIAFGAGLAVFYLKAARVLVLVSGPFVLSEVIQSARVPVERLSLRGASLLAHAPAPTRRQIEELWAQHLLVLHWA
jgi:hypothetical protein